MILSIFLGPLGHFSIHAHPFVYFWVIGQFECTTQIVQFLYLSTCEYLDIQMDTWLDIDETLSDIQNMEKAYRRAIPVYDNDVTFNLQTTTI